jgi:hypothetical protein
MCMYVCVAVCAPDVYVLLQVLLNVALILVPAAAVVGRQHHQLVVLHLVMLPVPTGERSARLRGVAAPQLDLPKRPYRRKQ